MIKCARVDNEGLFVRDVWLDQPSDDPDLVYAKIPSGLYYPKWNGTEWEEGMSQAEIDAIQNAPKPINPTDAMGEQLVQLELENVALKQQNSTLGQQLVAVELRLLQLEGGGA